MIVAAGAIHRHAEESLACRGDHVVVAVEYRLQRIGRFIVPEAQTVVAGGDDRVRVVAGQFVARELFLDELRVRLVVVEALDDVVAVAPRVGFGAVALVAVGFGEAHHIEPVPAPLLPVLWRREQLVDEFFVRVRVLAVDERVHVFRSRGQPREVVGRATNQRDLIGGLHRLQVLRFEFGEYERVNR